MRVQWVWRSRLEKRLLERKRHPPVQQAKNFKKCTSSCTLFKLSSSSSPNSQNTMREAISIHLGQAGSQVGNACWELYCLVSVVCSER